MERRPKLKVKLTPMDKAIEFTGLFTLLFMWGLAIYYFFILPDTIPIHFDASGKPDGYGQKATIFILPFTALIIFIVMTLLNKYPYIFNYPVNITASNALKQYTYGTRIIRYLKTAIIVIFTIILLFTYLTATGKSNGLSNWFLPSMLALLLIPTAYFIAKSYKIEK
ncbi:DUF1648 domain-containing protein [Ilyomonas limi]|uniref:DUF1648 domain-containing protein n=1 Tax=Ilyomonas limi TaxID=2575867 RepID=A0A4U3L4F6_9BACT|nr:DUF1648 domain-containing protein [Ilyomonas limi]TKK69209.1 DUF1648 domain-containing protein [Ilyomonas limi]